jgi:DNA-directed RNA polymerase subunit M/transcription elongation factor TFIIS
MAKLEIDCPKCQKTMLVPESAIGKRIRCKSCSAVFTVPDDDADEPTTPRREPAKPKTTAVKPKAAAPVKAKPASADPPPPPPADGPIAFADDDDDGIKQYTITQDDSDVPRCPRCAIELDPPDTKLCLNCGFDLVRRVRHQTKKVYAFTTGDYIMYWLPAVLWILTLLTLIGVVAYFWVNMRGIWLENEFLIADDKNKLTEETKFVIDPNACNVCCSVLVLGLGAWGVPVIYRRIVHPKPQEVEKRK